MLAPAHRLRRSTEFDRAVRFGRRAARGTVAVHVLEIAPDQPTRVGFVVSKGVGGAVARNRVKRRLRHLMRPVSEARPGLLLVVRANPGAAAADFDTIAADLDACLGMPSDACL